MYLFEKQFNESFEFALCAALRLFDGCIRLVLLLPDRKTLKTAVEEPYSYIY